MTGFSHTLGFKFTDQFNWLQSSLPSMAQQSLGMQRKLLETSLDLIYAPFLARDDKKLTESDALSTRLFDPALSFTTAVETAEPLFNMLNEEA